MCGTLFLGYLVCERKEIIELLREKLSLLRLLYSRRQSVECKKQCFVSSLWIKLPLSLKVCTFGYGTDKKDRWFLLERNNN